MLRNMPEPSNSQARRIRDKVQILLQVVAVQQTESSASRHRGAATEKPNYTYLKLKMPSPWGVITVSSSSEHAYECDVECVEYREAVERFTELVSKLEVLAAEAPEPKRHAGSFEPAEGTKKIPLDPNNSDGKALTISADLDPK